MDKVSSTNISKFISQCEENLRDIFAELDETALFNQRKVLNAFKNNSVAQRHFSGTNGYGYDDIGRDTLCKIYAEVLGSEKAIVSPLFVSGTHALSTMLFGSLKKGDKFISVSGMPYDTLTDVIQGENIGSLKDFGIQFESIDLVSHNGIYDFDFEKIKDKIESEKINAIFIQRSRGYSDRNALSCADIKKVVDFVKKIDNSIIAIVDNCYGEFVETIEPSDVGADVMAGSLIKNIGGGIAPTGGYIAGKSTIVDSCAGRLTAPSIGFEVGSYAFGYTQFYEGLFLAPTVVRNALKACCLFSEAYKKLGYQTLPNLSNTKPYDIVTSIVFNDKQKLIDFCRAIQECSPVDSNLLLEPWDMPGYHHQVIMAAGTFVAGSSIELSADAPIKEPYIVYVQGGLTYEHAKIALENTISKLGLL